MQDGKKQIAERIVYDGIEEAARVLKSETQLKFLTRL
jgi:ribosomal protein S7